LENEVMAIRYECFKCNKSLHGHPKIKVEGNICCYSCAKKVVTALDRVTEEKHAKEVKAYDVQYEKWKNWDEKRALALPSTNTQLCITLGVAVGCAVILVNPIFFLLPGLIVGFIVNHFYFHSQKKDWIRRNPEPTYPPYPSNNFVRDRIEIVGGVSGTPLSSSYREKILERDGYECQICGGEFRADRLEVHHIIPRAKRGKHYPANLVTLCWRCHVEEIWFGHKHKMRPLRRK
jgi:5-methylcytosine-specific restriction endonuclease McrA